MKKSDRIKRAKHAIAMRYLKRDMISEELNRFLNLMEYNEISNNTIPMLPQESFKDFYKRINGNTLEEWYILQKKQMKQKEEDNEKRNIIISK